MSFIARAGGAITAGGLSPQFKHILAAPKAPGGC